MADRSALHTPVMLPRDSNNRNDILENVKMTQINMRCWQKPFIGNANRSLHPSYSSVARTTGCRLRRFPAIHAATVQQSGISAPAADQDLVVETVQLPPLAEVRSRVGHVALTQAIQHPGLTTKLTE